MLENTENTGVKVAAGWPAGVFVMLIIFFQTQSEWKVSKEKAALSKKQGEGAAQKPQNKLETFLLKKALQRVEDGKLEPLVYKLTDIFFK